MSEKQSHTGVDPEHALILIACGTSDICLQLQTFLQKNYTVIQAGKYTDVFPLATEHNPDLIIVSADRQDRGGLALCEELQKKFLTRDPPAIMLIGPEDDQLIDQAFDAGADEYIRVPIHWKLLRLRVNFLIQKRKDELERNAFANRLEQTNRELREFAYVVSHDLQEPLHLIRAFAERIPTKTKSELDEHGLLYLQRIEKAASRMQSLIDGLLQYSRLTTRANDFCWVDLSEVVREVIADLEVRIDQLGARVTISELGKIEADGLQMRQLFQNLISNALKYSSRFEPPLIEVAATRTKNLIGRLPGISIVVKDNGIGFDSCFQEQIFGMFQRLHGRDDYNGTGIGLAICKKIVERHGGTICAHSSAGKGAEFVVVLPVQQINEKRRAGE